MTLCHSTHAPQGARPQPRFPVWFLAAVLIASGCPDIFAAEKAGEPANSGMKPEAQKESDWIDQRWNQTDVGPFLTSNLELPGARIARALSIKVGAAHEGSVCYDTATATWRAAWEGGFLHFGPARYGLIRPPAIQGKLTAQGAALEPPPRTRYLGLHVHQDRVVLSSVVNDTPVLESPWLVTNAGHAVFIRTLEVGAANQSVVIGLGTSDESPAPQDAEGGFQFRARSGDRTVAYRIIAPGAHVVRTGRNLNLDLPASTQSRLVQIAFCSVRGSEPADAFRSITAALTALPDPDRPSQWMKPGPARWLPESITRGQRGLDLDILAVDTLPLPYDNPWKALLFLAGVDFAPDGAAYVCSIHGDVWRVTGIDASLRELRWHRFATGLFQPLGLKVRDGQVYVLGRDQITRLHDANGDGEADYYESFHHQIATSTGAHDYVTCLEQDDRGNFYYVDPRGLHRVSADGQKQETIATGWRNPNGLGVSPDGSVLTVAPQQGDWTPSSQISQARPGGFYGYGGPRVALHRPLGYDVPLCWIPHSVDNSSGSQVWVPRGHWGPLGGQMLHLLWGRCALMLVLRDEVNGIAQGATLPLPGRFLSGPNRGSFNPRDGHLYVAGSTGWQTAAAKDGALQRVRFTDRPVLLPTAWHAHTNGLTVTFAQPLDPSAAQDPGSYAVHQWNYRYSSTYGSKDWSVAHPDLEGRDEVPVLSARLLPDQRTVFLQLPPLAPVMQLELKYSLNTAAGKAFRNQLWLTLNALDAARQ